LKGAISNLKYLKSQTIQFQPFSISAFQFFSVSAFQRFLPPRQAAFYLSASIFLPHSVFQRLSLSAFQRLN
jgi:hypothetical protein